MKRWEFVRDGDGWTVYFGHHTGARYVGIDPTGFAYCQGRWRHLSPTIHYGRVCQHSGYRKFSVRIPAALVDFYRRAKGGV
jgi:hypothetical protein